eukprot:GHRR01013041.1.p1 GENE.GHRR01013041.1~~GHRR01013041.1.p1  ORF type:complete len:174 (+),score=67.23 GHRR01013041.1:447-968(+)
MRMYPVAATGSVRETTGPTEIGQYKVPEGIVVWAMIYALQNSVHNWEQPEQFMPERWLDNRDCAYVTNEGADSDRRVRRFAPFSDGLKNCLGQALGLMEVRTVLATLLGRFWFELASSMGSPEKVRKQQQIALTLKMKEGLRLVIQPHEDPDSKQAAGSRFRAAARAPSGPLN